MKTGVDAVKSPGSDVDALTEVKAGEAKIAKSASKKSAEAQSSQE